MRTISRLISVCVLVPIILTLSIHAFAVEVSPLGDAGWEGEFRKFDTISQEKNGGTWNGYTCALQRFLGVYSTDLADVLDSSGNPDGYFGPVTKQAVSDYQQWKSLTVSQKADANTWGAIQWDMADAIYGNYTYFSIGGENIIRAESKTNGYDFYYYYYNFGSPVTRIFRSA